MGPTACCRVRAYPRERGGTGVLLEDAMHKAGLSPRARGNHVRMIESCRKHGPIPASAGEPKNPGTMGYQGRAYPRERGGTVYHPAGSGSKLGLSPRARGNRQTFRRPLDLLGPIPASAGEPITGGCWAIRLGAYPRERGGTMFPPTSPCGEAGLSPRARGNRWVVLPHGIPQGPIPASAGEPSRTPKLVAGRRAYPRERGGTVARVTFLPRPWGLSPRARGNRVYLVEERYFLGPIPASAGEPFGYFR